VCGLRAAVFWCIIAIIVLIIAAAVAGSVAATDTLGPLKKSASSSKSVGTTNAATYSASSNSRNATATSSSPSSIATLGIVVKQNMATSISGTTDYSTLQLQTFSEDMSSGNIAYRLYVSPQQGW
jgi:hypothetical protein